MDGRTHGRTDDGRKVITIAHPEQSSGELKKDCKMSEHSEVANETAIILTTMIKRAS